MKKNILLLIILFLMVYFSSLTFAVPAKDPYSQKICNVILNPDAVEGYQLIVFDNNGKNPERVKEDTCIVGNVYLIPDTIELKDIEIKEVEIDENSFDIQMCGSRGPHRTITNSGAISLRKFKPICAVIDECTADCRHPNTAPEWTDRYKIKYKKNYGDENVIDKTKYELKLYKWVNRINEEELKTDKNKAWNKESGEDTPVEDTYDDRDIQPSLTKKDEKELKDSGKDTTVSIISYLIIYLMGLIYG